MSALDDVKPKLRGWLHFGAAPLAFVLGLVLLVVTPTLELRAGVAVYVCSAVLLFGVSASYHLGAGGPRTNEVLHRLDHANIYIFIAGSYTPFAVALPEYGILLLVIVWGIAIIGTVIGVAWWSAPRWLVVGSYLALGWIAIIFLPLMWSAFGAGIVALVALGGVLYSLGAVVYARKKPDPNPEWFGYHEIFHAFTIVAFLVQLIAITVVVTTNG